MNWWKQIITGQDNETVAIGRVLGLIVFGLFLIALPVAAIVTMRAGEVSATDWGVLLDKLPVYVSMIGMTAAGMVGITAWAEPKPPAGDGQ